MAGSQSVGAQLTCLRETVSSLKALTITTNTTCNCNYRPTDVALTSFEQKIELKIIGLNA